MTLCGCIAKHQATAEMMRMAVDWHGMGKDPQQRRLEEDHLNYFLSSQEKGDKWIVKIFILTVNY